VPRNANSRVVRAGSSRNTNTQRLASAYVHRQCTEHLCLLPCLIRSVSPPQSLGPSPQPRTRVQPRLQFLPPISNGSADLQVLRPMAQHSPTTHGRNAHVQVLGHLSLVHHLGSLGRRGRVGCGRDDCWPAGRCRGDWRKFFGCWFGNGLWHSSRTPACSVAAQTARDSSGKWRSSRGP
jgi:hypothetical protein